jgi:hypothetical protein
MEQLDDPSRTARQPFGLNLRARMCRSPASAWITLPLHATIRDCLGAAASAFGMAAKDVQLTYRTITLFDVEEELLKPARDLFVPDSTIILSPLR